MWMILLPTIYCTNAWFQAIGYYPDRVWALCINGAQDGGLIGKQVPLCFEGTYLLGVGLSNTTTIHTTWCISQVTVISMDNLRIK